MESQMMVIDLMAEIFLFSRFNEVELTELAILMQRRSYKIGETICSEGDKDSFLFVIAKGEVEVKKKRHHETGTIVIARFGRGEMLGEMALMDNQPRSATVIATLPTEIYIFSKKQLDNLINTNLSLGAKFLRGLVELLSLRLRRTSASFADVF